jgi:hypothetical protein
VLIGIRPERIHLAHRLGDATDAGPLRVPATVMLREDLGGEDIVYLAAQGVPLTMVDRDHYRGDDLDAQVAISIYPHHLRLFDTATGQYVGQGLPSVATSPLAASSGATRG